MASPFAVLALSPTLDRAAVKRAYFAKLVLHPPHTDADAFRKLRDAYEALTAPGGLERAYAVAPIDIWLRLEQARARFDVALAEASRHAHQSDDARRQVKRFVEVVCR